MVSLIRLESRMRTSIAFVSALALSVAAAGCGDDEHLGPDGAPGAPDARPTGDGPVTTPSKAVMVAGDFATTGVFSSLDLPERTMHMNTPAGLAGSDPVIRHWGSELFIINRFGSDNITIANAGTFALVDQISTGGGSNPQDVAVVGDKLYVPALGTSGVVVIDRSDGNSLSTINLGALDPNDNVPDCVSAYAVGTKVFVACGILDGFTQTDDGIVAVIDTTTDTLDDSFSLPAANPFGFFMRSPAASVYGGDLLIGTTPSFSDFSTGCVARVSVGATPAANGCALTNMALGGYPNRLEFNVEGTLLWIVANTGGATPTGKLMGADLVSGELWDAPVSEASQLVVDVAACPDGLAVVMDRADGTGGARVYKDGTEVTSAALPIGLPVGFGANVVCYER
jgi:hypothetical protein